MLEYSVLLLLHILLFVYWLGGDLGVFYTSRYVCDPKLSRETRATVAHIMLFLDMAPRICLVLMLPVGVSLAAQIKLILLDTFSLAVLWVFSIAWLVLVVAVYRMENSTLGKRLQQFDMFLRVVIIAVLVWLSLSALAGHGYISGTWLAFKLLIFALIIACGLAIRVLLKPFGPAFASLMQGGSSPEVESQISQTIRRVKPFVLVIWVGLVIAAALGIFKP